MHYINGELISVQDLNIQHQQIKKYIDDIINGLNVELFTACKNRSNKVIMDIPTNFEVFGLSKDASRKHIIVELIKRITKNKYNVWIDQKKEYCRFEISWPFIQFDEDYEDRFIREFEKNID